MSFEERRVRREELCSLSSPEMEALKLRGNAAHSPGDFLSIAVEMSSEARRLILLAIRSGDPIWTINELMMEYFRLVCFPEPLPPGATNAILQYRYDPKTFLVPM